MSKRAITIEFEDKQPEAVEAENAVFVKTPLQLKIADGSWFLPAKDTVCPAINKLEARIENVEGDCEAFNEDIASIRDEMKAMKQAFQEEIMKLKFAQEEAIAKAAKDLMDDDATLKEEIGNLKAMQTEELVKVKAELVNHKKELEEVHKWQTEREEICEDVDDQIEFIKTTQKKLVDDVQKHQDEISSLSADTKELAKATKEYISINDQDMQQISTVLQNLHKRRKLNDEWPSSA